MTKEEQEIFDDFWKEKADVADIIGAYITKKDAKELFKLGIFLGASNN